MNSLVKFGGVAGAFLMLAAPVIGGTPTFEYVRTVDYSPHCCLGNIMAFVTEPDGTGIYAGDWYDDDIFYIDSPLTTNGTDNDLANTVEAADTAGAWTSGGWSYQDGDVDGNTVYIGGANDTDTQLFSVVQVSPGVWTTTQITGITGTYSGPTVVGTNKLAMADYNTGALQFFTVAAGVATPDGSPIPNTNITTEKTLSVSFDATSGNIFAYIVDDNLTRRIDIFSSDGTVGNTSYVGTWADGVVGTLTAAGGGFTSHNRSSQITINDEYRVLVCPFRDGTDDGFDVFDISTVGATGTPYEQIRSGDLNFPEFTGSGVDITGSAFFTDGTDDYLALGVKNALIVQKVVSAAVSNWSLY